MTHVLSACQAVRNGDTCKNIVLRIVWLSYVGIVCVACCALFAAWWHAVHWALLQVMFLSWPVDGNSRPLLASRTSMQHLAEGQCKEWDLVCSSPPESNLSRCGFRGSSHIGIPYSTKVLLFLTPHCFQTWFKVWPNIVSCISLKIHFGSTYSLLWSHVFSIFPFELILLKIFRF